MRGSLSLTLTFCAMTAMLACREEAEPPTGPTTQSPASAMTTAPLAFRQVSAAAHHFCGVTTDDRAYCWGSNGFGELGNGAGGFGQFTTAPVAVAGDHRFRTVSAGPSSFTCAVTTDARGYCWGYNVHGELGIGRISDRDAPELTPVPVAGNLRFTQVSAGQNHACAVTTDSRVYCWGYNGFGQLGDGTTIDRPAPVQVQRQLRFSRVDAGNYHTCAVTTHNHAYCWGENSYGQLGTRGGGRDWQHAHLRPTVAAGGLKLRQVNAGYYTSCGVTTQGRAYCWGKNDAELGSVSPGDYDFERIPRLVAGGLTFREVDPSYAHTCGATTGNVAYCWGVLGNLVVRPTPVIVPGGLRFRQVSTGYYNACGVTTADAAYCWGGENLTPVPVPGPM